jgi:hypothetical protein
MPIEHLVTALSIRLANIAGNPQQVIYAITTQDMLQIIARRMGAKALQLSAKDLMQARQNVREAIEQFSNHRECINKGLDIWELTRTAPAFLEDDIPDFSQPFAAAA